MFFVFKKLEIMLTIKNHQTVWLQISGAIVRQRRRHQHKMSSMRGKHGKSHLKLRTDFTVMHCKRIVEDEETKQGLADDS